jgi:hypothetical protein
MSTHLMLKPKTSMKRLSVLFSFGIMVSFTNISCDEPQGIATHEAGVEEAGSTNVQDGLVSPDRARQPTNKLKILTTQSPSVIAWGEIEVHGSAVSDLSVHYNLAAQQMTTASSHFSAQPPSLAVDGHTRSMWNAGTQDESWIEVDLGQPSFVTEIRLYIAQDQPGLTVHDLIFVDELGTETTVHRFNEYTRHGQWLTFQVDQDSLIAGDHTMPQGGNDVELVSGDEIELTAGDEPNMMMGGDDPPINGPTVGKWRRLVLSFEHDTFDGQPFLVEMNARFTHLDSGLTLTLPAYYDGNSTWRIAFMPTKLGAWRWQTISDISELDGHSGELTAIASGHQGLLTADLNYPNKWRYLDGPPVVPIGLFVNGMLDDVSDEEFERFAASLGEYYFSCINFRLSENDFAFSDVTNLRLNLELWQRLERRLEILTNHGVGVDLMLYTDDSGRPSFAGQSPAEQLLIRHMVARLSSFPSVLFNTGIDLIEYRDQAWVNWFGSFVKSIDPYGHPISSRYGGGSGNLIMTEQTFNSVGARNSSFNELLTAYDQSDQIPALNNDNWSEDLDGLNGHTPNDIRRAAWKALMVGGVGFSVRHNTLYCPHGITECDRYFPISQAFELLDSEQWLKLTNVFIREYLGDRYQAMRPRPDLVSAQGGKYALADDQYTHLLFFLVGHEDTWNRGDGGVITLQLGEVNGSFMASWFDPRTGTLSSAGTLVGGQNHQLTPPSQTDWVLWLSQ